MFDWIKRQFGMKIPKIAMSSQQFEMNFAELEMSPQQPLQDEQKWNESQTLEQMIGGLRGWTSNRKFWLLACAAARLGWSRWQNQVERGETRNFTIGEGIEVLERYADGLADEAEWVEVREGFMAFLDDAGLPFFMRHSAGSPACWEDGCAQAQHIVVAVRMNVTGMRWQDQNVDPDDFPSRVRIGEAVDEEIRGIIRDVMGNPFRPAKLDRNWLANNGRDSVAEARRIYEDFARLPRLGGMLIESGCECEDLVAHCQQAGPHVRGCWAVDLLTGKS